MCGIFHSYYKKVFKLNYFLVAIIFICFFSVGKYHLRFNEERKFNELENVNLSKAIDAKNINAKLKGLKWITHLHPNNPEEEVKNLNQAINIFKKDKSKKMLLQIIKLYLNFGHINNHQSMASSICKFSIKRKSILCIQDLSFLRLKIR